MANPNRWDITDGPSKWDLMLALFDGDAQHRRWHVFTVSDPQASPREKTSNLGMPILVNGLAREDGSGENWLFNGEWDDGTIAQNKVRGFFSTKTRKGWIELP